MKILIVGAGVIGAIYGWAFANAGHSVTHLVRPGRREKLANGIAMDVMDLRKSHKKWFKGNYAIQTVESLDAGNDYDVVLVPVRQASVEGVLQQLVPLTPKADYALLIVNWEGVAGIEKHLPRSRYVLAEAKAGGKFQDGKLISTLRAVHLGSIDPTQDRCLEVMKQLFSSADIKINLEDNMLHYCWVEYAMNTGGVAAVARAGSSAALTKDSRLWNASFAASQECLAVAAARGVDIRKHPLAALTLTKSRIKLAMVRFAAKLLFRGQYVQRNSAHALSDPQELRDSYCDLINTGAQLGIAMPVMLSFKKDIDDLQSRAHC